MTPYYVTRPRWTRTTRTPAFWEYPHRPMISHTTDQSIFDPKSKQDKVKVTNLKNLPKSKTFWKKKKTLHTTQLKLLYNMYKHEMDPVSILEDAERTRFCPQTDRRADGGTRWNKYTPFNFVEKTVKTSSNYKETALSSYFHINTFAGGFRVLHCWVYNIPFCIASTLYINFL